VFRWASDHRPPTLYLRRTAQGVTVASEPLTDDEDDWRALADGEFLALTHTKRRAAEALAV
jgi:predicted glutamine amidotransferase